MPDHTREARALINEKGRLGARVELRLREVTALEQMATALGLIAIESRVQTEVMSRLLSGPDAQHSKGIHSADAPGRWVRDDGWEVTQDLGRTTWGVLTPEGERWLLTPDARKGGLSVDVWEHSSLARTSVDLTIAPVTQKGLAVGWRHEATGIGL